MRIARRALVLFLLIIGLVVAGSTRSTTVNAKTCMEAYYEWEMANWAYDTARISYFYDSPETCSEECDRLHPWDPINDPNDDAYNQCVASCPTNRHTALDAADSLMFAKALQTCTPIQPDECDTARANYAGCFVNDYWDYPVESDEHWAVFDQFWACREASKIDYCQ